MTLRSGSYLADGEGIARAPRGASPDTRSYRLETVGTRAQRAVFVAMQLCFLAALLWLSVRLVTVVLAPLVGATATAALLIVYAAVAVFWQGAYVYRILKMKRAVLIDTRVPSGLRIAMATTIVPSRELALLRGKLEGMVRVDRCGNTLDCWVLDEEDDPRVKAMIREFNHRYRRRGARFFHFTRKHHAAYNTPPEGRRFSRFQQRQKGGNINAWLDAISLAHYDILTLLDLDHVPKPEFYRRVLPYFRDRDVAFVQGPESFRNRAQNFITRAASFERDTYFGVVHRSYFGLGMPVIVGAHTTFRAETIAALGGSYPVHLTEDYLIMLELRALRKRGIFVDEVLAVGELPSTWTAYLGQQHRWAAGGLDLLFRYLPRLLRRYTLKEQLYSFALLNYYVWGTFYVFTKGALCALLLAGAVLHFQTGLILGAIAFLIVSALANHLWEKQFYIEREQRSFFLENALMNNVLGGHYFVALLKAVACPNRPFAVTAKGGAPANRPRRVCSYLLLSALFVALDVGGLAAASFLSPSAGGLRGQGYGNLLAYPLLASAAGSLLVLLAWRHLERRETGPARPRLRVFVSSSAARTNRLERRGWTEPSRSHGGGGSRMRRASSLALVYSLALALGATRADAALIHVAAGEVIVDPGNGLCSLREAIDNANAGGDTSGGDCTPGDPGPNRVILASNSTYDLPDAADNTSGLSGLPAIRSAIDIRANGSTIQRSAALFTGDPCNSKMEFRIFFVDIPGALTLEDAELHNGCAEFDDSGAGGAIMNLGSATLINGVVSGNEASLSGGAIQNDGALELIRTTVSDNAVIYGAGGGIVNTGTFTSTQSTLSGNGTTGAGGAMYNPGMATLGNSTLSGNAADGTGGGVQNDDSAALVNVTVSANLAGADSDNPATTPGGGVYNDTFNLAVKDLTLANTIVAKQISGTDCSGTTSEGHNLDSDGSCAVQPTDLTSSMPGLGPLATNGGGTQTQALLPGSPAIDHADNATCAAEPVNGIDQRGVHRPANGGLGLFCDIGAFELAAFKGAPVASVPVLAGLAGLLVLFGVRRLRTRS